MTLKRIARADLEIKSFDDSSHTLRGMATTPGPDRVGDVIEPMGAKFGKEIPLFLYHDDRLQVGTVKLGPANKNGVPFEANIPNVVEPGTLKTRVEEAWHMLKYNLLKTVSIGFMPLGDKIERLKSGGLRFLETEILELSLVPIPMNADAQVSYIRSIDQSQRAALGHTQRTVLPGASGKSTGHSPFTNRSPKGNDMKTMQDLMEERSTKAARMNELTQAWADRQSTEEEGTEFDGLEGEVKQLDDSIRKMKLDAINVAKAKPVDQTDSGRRGKDGYVFVRGSDQEEKFKGQNFTRMVIAKALSHRDEYHRSPATLAEMRWGKSNPTLVAILKANEVPGGGAGSGEWGAELVSADNRYTGDFLEFIYGMTVFDKLPLREVPANIAIKGQDGAATGYWVGESKAIPNTAPSFVSNSLTPLKVAALAVCSNELLRDSSPAAEGLIRDALAEASAQRIDTTFLSATAASAGVSPAGILNGLSATSASGTDAAALRADLKAVLATFDTAKDTGNLQIVTTRALARSISLMFNSLGTAQDFPGTTPNGGSLLSYPVIVGDNVPSGDIIVLNPREIYKIGDMGITVSVSQDAMIEQSSAPTGATDTPTAASQVFTSMFQEESTAIKVVRPINFAKRRSTAVAFISGADYGNEAS